MNTSSYSNLYYYGVVTLVTAPLIYAFILWLEWPLLAGIIFGGALYLHILNMSKNAKEYALKVRKEGIKENSFIARLINKLPGQSLPSESKQN